MSDPYLDALEQLDQMRDRAFKAEAARDRLANQLLNEVPDSYIQMKARALDAEAAIQRVRALAEQASTVIARGCTCYGNDCTGKCRRGEPMGWDLDPVKVLAALAGEDQTE